MRSTTPLVEVNRLLVRMVVVSTAVLFDRSESWLRLVIVAVLSTDGAPLASGKTVKVNTGKLAPAVKGPGWVQVTSCPTAAQLQLVPENPT